MTSKTLTYKGDRGLCTGYGGLRAIHFTFLSYAKSAQGQGKAEGSKLESFDLGGGIPGPCQYCTFSWYPEGMPGSRERSAEHCSLLPTQTSLK